MDVLISFCNLRAPALPALGLIDTATLGLRVLRLPAGLPRIKGITGLAANEHFIFAGIQALGVPEGGGFTAHSSLLVLDRKTLALANHHLFRSVIEVHSLWLAGDTLYCVSTGTDEVVAATLLGASVVSEEVFWHSDPGGPREDIHHLNSICGMRGELLVTGFGKRAEAAGGEPAPSWKTANNGFILNLTRNEKIVAGIDQPHSLAAAADGTIVYCESQRMAVRAVGGSPACTLPGYTRGLCFAGGKIIVATSVGRRVSRSSGTISNPGHLGERSGTASISRLAVDDFAVEASADLSIYGYEIYELLPVGETADWPFVSEIEWRDEALRELAAALDTTRAWGVRNATARAAREAELEAKTAEVEGVKSLAGQWRDELDYERFLRRLNKTARALLPPGAKTLVVSKGDEDLLREFEGIEAWHFPCETDGTYAGRHPADSDEAVAQLESLCTRGAEFLVIPAPSLWWLDSYPGFAAHLKSIHREVARADDNCIIFDLRPNAIPPPANA